MTDFISLSIMVFAIGAVFFSCHSIQSSKMTIYLSEIEGRQTAKSSRLEDMVKALLDNAGIDFEPSDP
jgi:hypothetical protein